MKRCWIYCGVKPHTSIIEMGLYRDYLKRYAEKKGYFVVSFTSENMYLDFVRCNGSLEVLEAIRDKEMDVLLLEEGILNHQDETIQHFMKFAKEHQVEIEEIEIKMEDIKK